MPWCAFDEQRLSTSSETVRPLSLSKGASGEQWQQELAAERGELDRSGFGRIHPDELLDLLSDLDRSGYRTQDDRRIEDAGVEHRMGLVRRICHELIDEDELVGVDDQAELLLEFAGESRGIRLPGFGLAARLHEPSRTALPHQQGPATLVDDECRDDAENGGGVRVGHRAPTDAPSGARSGHTPSATKAGSFVRRMYS